MTSAATRSVVSPVDVMSRTDLNPDAAMQIAVDGTHVLFRRHNLDAHDGFEQHGFRFLHRVLKRE